MPEDALAEQVARDRQLADLRHRFAHHPPDDEKAGQHSYLRGLFLQMALRIAETTKPSREQSLAFTALEEAMFWANAAIARER